MISNSAFNFLRINMLHWGEHLHSYSSFSSTNIIQLACRVPRSPSLKTEGRRHTGQLILTLPTDVVSPNVFIAPSKISNKLLLFETSTTSWTH